MATREYKLKGHKGVTVYVDAPDTGPMRVGRFEKAVGDLSDAIKPAAGVIDAVAKSLGGIKCEELSVEFGVQLGAAAGIVITNISTQANLKITVKFKPAVGRDGK